MTRLLVAAIACWTFAVLNVAVVACDRNAVASLNIVAAIAAGAAGAYAFDTWRRYRA